MIYHHVVLQFANFFGSLKLFYLIESNTILEAIKERDDWKFHYQKQSNEKQQN